MENIINSKELKGLLMENGSEQKFIELIDYMESITCNNNKFKVDHDDNKSWNIQGQANFK